MEKCILCQKEFKNVGGLGAHLRHRHPEIKSVDYQEIVIPKNECKCGCGQIPEVYRWKRNEYIAGHNVWELAEKRIGIPLSDSTKAKIGKVHKGKTISPEQRKVISEWQKVLWTEEKREAVRIRVKGENHPNWKGGRFTPEKESEYRVNQAKIRDVRDECLERDNYTCQMCKTHQDNLTKPLSLHHIKSYFDSYDNSKENLICLCHKCHAIADRSKLSREEILRYNM